MGFFSEQLKRRELFLGSDVQISIGLESKAHKFIWRGSIPYTTHSNLVPNVESLTLLVVVLTRNIILFWFLLNRTDVIPEFTSVCSDIRELVFWDILPKPLTRNHKHAGPWLFVAARDPLIFSHWVLRLFFGQENTDATQHVYIDQCENIHPFLDWYKNQICIFQTGMY